MGREGGASLRSGSGTGTDEDVLAEFARVTHEAFASDAAASGRYPANVEGLADLEECADALVDCADALARQERLRHMNRSYRPGVTAIVQALRRSTVADAMATVSDPALALRIASNDVLRVARSLYLRADIAKNTWWLQPRVPAGSSEAGRWTDGSFHTANSNAGQLTPRRIDEFDDSRAFPSGISARSQTGKRHRIVGNSRLRTLIEEAAQIEPNDALFHRIAAPIKDPEDRKAIKQLSSRVTTLIKAGSIYRFSEISLQVLNELNENTLQIPQIRSFFDHPLPLDQIRLSPHYEEFDTHVQLSRKYPANPGYEIHHPVPQHPRNIWRFGYQGSDGKWKAPKIHNTDNSYYVPAIKHWIMHGMMHGKTKFGMSLSEYMLLQSFERQREIGLYIMNLFNISEE